MKNAADDTFLKAFEYSYCFYFSVEETLGCRVNSLLVEFQTIHCSPMNTQPSEGSSSLSMPVTVAFPGHSRFREDKMVVFRFLVTNDVECTFMCSLPLMTYSSFVLIYIFSCLFTKR